VASVEEAIAKAREDGIVIEREYRQQRLVPAFMEPRSTVVDPTGEQVTMWTATQVPHILRFLIAATTGMPEIEGARHRPRCGRRLRWQAADDARGVHHTRGRSTPGQAGQIHRNPFRVTGVRPPRPRPVSEAHAQRDQGRDRHRAQGRPDRQPRSVCRGRRRRCARPGRVDVQRDLQIPGVSVQLPDGPDEHDLGGRLPRRWPTRGDLRHRAADGRTRRRSRASTRSRSGRRTGSSTRSSPSSSVCGDDLRLGQLRSRDGSRQGTLRLRRVAGRAEAARRESK
jgi:hypothetical protein